MNCSVIILSAGNSDRMGTPKALLEWDNKTTFLEKIISEYQKAVCEKIVVIINSEIQNKIKLLNQLVLKNVEFVLNPVPDNGRFSSLKLGIEKVLNSEYCFIQNIDNPFTDESLLSFIYKSRSLNSYIVPTFKGNGGHPILINKSISEYIHSLDGIEFNIKTVLSPFNKECIDTENEKILLNINTPEEYRKYFHTIS